VELFHWHLRSFFWEMVAVRDSLRREANTDSKIKATVESLNNQQWFKEVLAYRNFTHVSFHVVERFFSHETGKALVFQLQRAILSQTRMGDGMALMKDYWGGDG